MSEKDWRTNGLPAGRPHAGWLHSRPESSRMPHQLFCAPAAQADTPRPCPRRLIASDPRNASGDVVTLQSQSHLLREPPRDAAPPPPAAAPAAPPPAAAPAATNPRPPTGSGIPDVRCGTDLFTGIPLPFVSYGGSALVANFALIALMLRISDTAVRGPTAGRKKAAVGSAP